MAEPATDDWVRAEFEGYWRIGHEKAKPDIAPRMSACIARVVARFKAEKARADELDRNVDQLNSTIGYQSRERVKDEQRIAALEGALRELIRRTNFTYMYGAVQDAEDLLNSEGEVREPPPTETSTDG